jgi:hypothetical protein
MRTASLDASIIRPIFLLSKPTAIVHGAVKSGQNDGAVARVNPVERAN